MRGRSRIKRDQPVEIMKLIVNYKQCRMIFENRNIIGWIETRGANPGALVEMEDGNFWIVEQVYDTEISKNVMRQKQDMNRNAFAFIRK